MRCIAICFFASLWMEVWASCFVFVHVGPEVPAYAAEAVRQVRLFNTEADIYMLAEQEVEGAVWVPLHSLERSEAHEEFLARTPLVGFWRYATERFFYLEEFVKRGGLREVIHLENDVMVYFEGKELLESFRKCCKERLGAVFDNDRRCIPGLVYVPEAAVLARLTKFLAQEAGSGKNDMELLALFEGAEPLPVVPPEYGKSYWLRSLSGLTAKDPSFFSRHAAAFASLFDAAALGQYLGGIDPIHPGGGKAGFVNESALYNPSFFHYEWVVDEGGRKVPFLHFEGKRWRINNLHIHSKNLAAFSSRNGSMPRSPTPLPAELERGVYEASDEPVDAVVLGSSEPYLAALKAAGVGGWWRCRKSLWREIGSMRRGFRFLRRVFWG